MICYLFQAEHNFQVNMAPNISKIGFNHKISKISELGDDEWTPEFTLQGVLWDIRFYKEVYNEEDWFIIALYCLHEDNSCDWSYAASATLKFLPFNRKMKAEECFVPPCVFNHFGKGYSENMIKWRDLFDAENSFVKDDTINLKIEVDVADPNSEDKSILKFELLDKCCEKSGTASIRLKFSNIDNLAAVKTPDFMVRDLRWNLTIRKHQSKYLGVFLDRIDKFATVSCKIRASFKLISSKGPTKCITMEREQIIKCLDLINVKVLVSWDQLLDEENGFVVNNEITIEVEVKANKPTGVMPSAQERPSNESKLLKMECKICIQSIRDQEVSILPYVLYRVHRTIHQTS